MVTEEIRTTVEVDGVERDVTAVFILRKEVKPRGMSPGYPAEAELMGAIFDDGSEIPEGLLSDPEELGREAMEQRADRESAMSEDAADARREFRRDGY